MGHMIEGILRERGHKISMIIDEENRQDLYSGEFAKADVAIEFTRPDSAVDNILHCFAAGVPVVSGTTGWTKALPELEEMCRCGEGSLLWTSNFSIGMNIFMSVNRYLTKLISKFPEYHPSMEEVHHIHKLDHPSGTALSLAADLISLDPEITGWKEPTSGEILSEEVLPIVAKREGEVPGIHSIRWDSEADDITITHSAKSRRGFAMGAVIAAEWLAQKREKGFFSMADVLGF